MQKLHRFRRHWLRILKTRDISLFLASIAGIGLAFLMVWALDGHVRPVLIPLAQAKATNAVEQVIGDTVAQVLAEEAISYGDIISLEKDHNGQIIALTSQTLKLNRLRSELLNRIIEQVDLLDRKKLRIPMGNLTGLTLLSERGPSLPVRIRSVAQADASFRNVFSSAGINQTHHQIFLDISVELLLLIPGGTVETQVCTQLCIAETVLVGEVPQTYLQLSPPFTG